MVIFLIIFIPLAFLAAALLLNYFIQKKAFENGLVDANKRIENKKIKNRVKDFLLPKAQEKKEEIDLKNIIDYSKERKLMTQQVLLTNKKENNNSIE